MKILIVFTVFFFSLIIKFSLLANENKILLKVNNELITTIDVSNEINYLKSVNKNFENLETQKIIEIARNSLIKDKIKKITLLPIVKEFEINEKKVKQLGGLFIIGTEIVFLFGILLIIRFAKKCSRFNIL